jgi:DNA-binding transcriptional MerR regulator/methylmalonyl-CoA mutase cobalamin-binding subunit
MTVQRTEPHTRAANPASREMPHDALPVRTVARMTGLTADVIRAWEKRYGVVQPLRGPRGARLYCADDVDHLRLLARVVEAGRAIGDVAALDRASLERLAGVRHPTTVARAPSGERTGVSIVIDRVLDAMDRFDAEDIERILHDALLAMGSGPFIRDLLPPLLQRVGDLWNDRRLSVGTEHLVSAVVRNLLTGLLRGRRAAGRPAVLLATPSGERHEFGLLLAALVILEAGVGVSYLGVDLPAADILAGVERTRVPVLGLSVVNGENRGRAVAEIQAITQDLPHDVTLWLGGSEASVISRALAHPRTVVVDQLETIDHEVAQLARSGARAAPA